MAERRMFAKTIIDSDAFLDMPLSTQALYFHLAMRADDDGFLNNPKKIQRVVGCSDDDFRLLMAKNFIIAFESGVVVIKHWRIHNYIQADRYKPTVYAEEKAMLSVKENRAYTLNSAPSVPCIQDVYIPYTQNSIDKNSLDKNSLDKNSLEKEQEKPKNTKHKYGDYKNVLLTDEELEKLKERFPTDWNERIQRLDGGIELKGYKYKSHYLAILKWSEKDAPKTEKTEKRASPTAADINYMTSVLNKIKGGK